MFVYVAEFLDRPGLIKVGVAKNTKERMTTLRSCHGRSFNVREFNLGEDCFTIEKLIHKKYKKSNIRLEEKCDGYTEFFDELVKDDVERLLNGISESIVQSPDGRGTDHILEHKEMARKKVERIRFENKLSKGRIANCDELQEKRAQACERESLFIQKMIGHKDYGSYTFGILHYMGLASLNYANKAGVDIEHLVNPIIKEVQSLRRDLRPKLTKWKVLVLLSAVSGKTSRRGIAERSEAVYPVCKVTEDIYLDMVSEVGEVNLDCIMKLPSAEDERAGDSLSSEYARKTYNGSSFRISSMRHLLQQRAGQTVQA